MKPFRLPTIRTLKAALATVRNRTGAPSVELYVKVGASRRLEVDPWRPAKEGLPAPEDWRIQVSTVEERGWALRAGGETRALFAAESGTLPGPGGWRLFNRGALRPGALKLPPRSRQRAPRPADHNERPGPGSDSEALGRALVQRILERTRAELPGVRLVRARLDDGASASVLANSAGATGRTSLRLATAEVEFAVERNSNSGRCRLYRAAGALEEFDAKSIALDAADRLTLATGVPTSILPVGEVAISPALACHLLTLLGPLFVGAAGWEKLHRLSSGRPLGPPDLQILDDGTLENGWIRAPVDDEGVPTRAVALVKNGEPGEPLLAWEDDGWSGFSATGCRRRSGWRVPPKIGHSHLYIARGRESAYTIRSGIRHGCYLLDAAPGGRRQVAFDPSGPDGEASFELDATGFVVDNGNILGAIPRARLSGSIRQLFQGIRAIGDDLCFLPTPGAIGAPTLLLTGLQLEPV